MQDRHALLSELEFFLLAGGLLPAGLWVSNVELVAALVTYLRVGWVFKRKGLAGALRMIPAVAAPRPVRAVNSAATVFCARAAAWRLRGLARTVAGRHLCLHESLGLCAALRKLGFPVQVVIGYPLIEPADGAEELHAWPALGPIAVTGPSEAYRLSYVELFRYPKDPTGHASLPPSGHRASHALCGKLLSCC